MVNGRLFWGVLESFWVLLVVVVVMVFNENLKPFPRLPALKFAFKHMIPG